MQILLGKHTQVLKLSSKSKILKYFFKISSAIRMKWVKRLWGSVSITFKSHKLPIGRWSVSQSMRAELGTCGIFWVF